VEETRSGARRVHALFHHGRVDIDERYSRFVGDETGISMYGRALTALAASAIATPEKRSVLIVIV
jgi:hypothetical protein